LHEQQLREAIQHAEVANQVKSDFLAMISHELRTPLNAILGMAQILKTKGIPAHLEEHVDIISSAGHSLLSLVSDILDFAKLEAGKLSFTNEPFNLRQLFSQVMNGFQYQANEKQIMLDLEFLGDVSGSVIGDANRVRQILVNLLSNALKFTDQGTIQVIVHCIKQSKNKALFEVAVKDTGIGIRADKLAFVFEKFSQIDSIYRRKHGGIGLGLAITKQLIEAMGGEIYVKSEYGQGSTFRFTIPLSLQSLADSAEASTNQTDGGILRQQYDMSVLVVEDNMINQKIAKVMLEDFGCHVDVMDNGQSVLEHIHDLERYHLIFMDVGLPDISGFDIVRQLREVDVLKQKPIIAMTAHILDRDRQEAFAAGMDRIIAKPISYNEIGMVLGEVARSCKLVVE
jgi:CheY-like chemotaxis protein